MQTTRVRRYFQPDFFQAVLAIALPMTAQNFIMSAVNMVDVVMIGALGDVAIAAVGVAIGRYRDGDQKTRAAMKNLLNRVR